MKISCIQENLKQGLMLVSNITSRNVNLPILNNVLIQVKENLITLSSTNLEIGITSTIRGKIEKEGAFTVEAKLLADYINLLPRERIDIELTDSNLHVSCNNNKTKIKGISAVDFPLIPDVKKDRPFICNAEHFRKALSQVILAASTNESRPEISGVYLHFNKETVTVTATDSYRLAEKVISLEESSNSDDMSVIVPLRTLQEVVRILSNVKDSIDLPPHIEMYISEGQVLFVYDSVELVSRLIDGQYPDYKQIIPKNFETHVYANINDLVKAVKTSSLFSKSGINDVSLEFIPGEKGNEAEGHIKVSSMNDQVGENTSIVPAAIEGLQNGIVLNYSFFLDGLNNIDTPDVKISLIDSSSPCALTPKGADNSKDYDKNESYLYIVMPIRQ